jgi:hypothetical protein
MKTTVPITFEVESLEAPEELTDREAYAAAEQAAFDFLSFVKVSGYSPDSESVEVHVDGHGKCRVRLTLA